MSLITNQDDFTMGMGFLPGIKVTLDNMTTNVPASTLPAWAANVQYALNEEIIDADRMIWRSMVANNLGNNPATSDGKWQKRGVENRLRMFDVSLGTVTEADDLIEIAVRPGRVVTDVMLMGVQAYSVQLIVTDPIDGVVKDVTEYLSRPSGNSHWGYFFNPLESETKLHISDLPAYTQATITIRISNPGAKVRCAEVVIARAVWLGNTQWRPSIGFDDWGEKKRDPWGGWTLQEGAYSDRLKLQVLVHSTQYERTRNEVLRYRGRPVVWIGARGYNVLTTYGGVTGFEQVLVADGISDCNLTIEGLEDDALHAPA